MWQGSWHHSIANARQLQRSLDGSHERLACARFTEARERLTYLFPSCIIRQKAQREHCFRKAGLIDIPYDPAGSGRGVDRTERWIETEHLGEKYPAGIVSKAGRKVGELLADDFAGPLALSIEPSACRSDREQWRDKPHRHRKAGATQYSGPGPDHTNDSSDANRDDNRQISQCAK